MPDGLVRAVAADGTVLACATVATHATEEARRRHGTLPTATAALGRGLVAAAMLGATLKGRQTVMIRVLGDGPLGPMISESTADGTVRGYVTNPRTDLPPTPARKLDVGGAVGRRGIFHVTRDLGLRDPYQGSVPLVSGEIGEDLAAYLMQSEQVPSVVAVGVLVSPQERVLAAGGLLLQVMPGAPAWIPAYLEERARALPAVTQMVRDGASPDEMLRVALGGLPLAAREERPVRFACRCSARKVEDVLVALGRAEADRLLHEEGRIEVQCRFCGERYVLGAAEVAAVFAASDDARTGA
ncbi:MAG: Hsp33 family molecular chaperone HslO [Armatimonadota bacterium]|nr:Hsp33 family molecular chaperone HslO [Armatimonadota bacterium]MDR7532715.1 Hsp33 family molecular chaperone HslO [Armatimonadota bacterium]MDR7535335.1 Hsp33 family molecular chaperone HslO [Armatimonadota bacterium]